MFFLAGSAAGSAMDLIGSLTKTLSGSQTGTGVTTGVTPAKPAFEPASGQAGTTTPSAQRGATGTSSMAPTTMNALLRAQGQQSRGNSLSSQLFSLLDGDRNGTVSQTEFEKVFAQNGDSAKAASVFATVDRNGDGSVNQMELTSALRGGNGRHHGMAGPGGIGGSSDGTSNSNKSGTTSQSVTNADGSVTTTITYADGTKLSMTKPAAHAGSGAASLLERMFQRQAQMLAASSAGQALAVTA